MGRRRTSQRQRRRVGKVSYYYRHGVDLEASWLFIRNKPDLGMDGTNLVPTGVFLPRDDP